MSLSYPKIITSLPGPKAEALVKKDRGLISPSYTRMYPLVAARGAGCLIEDVDGNQFLDMTAGIAVTATGHCHPQVVTAIKEQAEKLIHMSGTDFYYPLQTQLAARLADHMPGKGPNAVFFCNSGAEAVEGALKLARYHSGRTHFISFQGAFHGRTFGALSVTASKPVQKSGFLPLLPDVHYAPFPDPRRCPSEKTPESYATECIDWIRKELLDQEVRADQVAAIIVEPIQGEGGYIIPPPNFHPELQALCREHGILYIIDEVQAGMGRTGKFFAFEHFGVEPDIITVAKGIASGLPLGAVISSAEIMDWPPGAHASTFGGNPIACAAALATLDLVEAELMSNAARQGDALQAALTALAAKHDWLQQVRGMGLMVAVDVKDDDKTLQRRDRLVLAAFKKGLLLLGCGKRSIRFCPALSVSTEEIESAVSLLGEVCSEI